MSFIEVLLKSYKVKSYNVQNVLKIPKLRGILPKIPESIIASTKFHLHSSPIFKKRLFSKQYKLDVIVVANSFVQFAKRHKIRISGVNHLEYKCEKIPFMDDRKSVVLGDAYSLFLNCSRAHATFPKHLITHGSCALCTTVSNARCNLLENEYQSSKMSVSSIFSNISLSL